MDENADERPYRDTRTYAVPPGGHPCGETKPHPAHGWTYLHPDDARHCLGVPKQPNG